MCTDCNEITIPNGVDGENAYTVLTSSYTQPAVNTNVTISVSNTGQYSTGWCAIGQLIYVAVGGYYEVVSKTASTITIKYTASYTTYNQSLTAAAGTVPNSGVVSPGGIIGATGATGSNGSNGTNGTTILSTYNSTTGVGTPATLLETTLFTYSVPSNTLATNGDELELYAYYEYFNNDPVTLRVKLGAKIVSFTVINAADDYRILKIKISRISSTSQIWTIEESIRGVGEGAIIGSIRTDSSTVDLATILVFEITGQNAAAGANQVTLKKATLYKYTA